MPEQRLALVELLRELNDLKRVHSANAAGSIAERLFAQAWAMLAAGEPTDTVMCRTLSCALVATRLGDLPGVLPCLGIEPLAVRQILRASLADHAGLLAEVGIEREALAGSLDLPQPVLPPPAFVAMLARQPRAGVTCPGRPRLLFEPPESHAEHCLMVAVYGVLLAKHYDADPETVFLAGLVHHLHNALMPDAGFTGETLLGRHLEPAIGAATGFALDLLDESLRARVQAARRCLPDATTPEGRAFNAADTIDRVLQIDQHLRAGRTTLRFVLDTMQLVHAGPVKPFQDAVLHEFSLA